MNQIFSMTPQGGPDPEVMKKEDMLICVTGASGYIGGHIAKQLCKNGYKVRGTVRDTGDRKNYHYVHDTTMTLEGESLDEYRGQCDKLELFTVCNADLNNEEDWSVALRGCTHCIHLAAPVYPRNQPEIDVYNPHVEGTRFVIEACVKNNVKRFIHTSAIEAVYGPDLKAYLFNEKSWADTAGKDSYSTGKIDAEKGVWELYEYYKDQLEIVSIVPANVVGPFIAKSAIGTMCRAMRELLNGELYYIPEMSIPVCTIEDLC